jgi:hypothetical protein
MKEGTAMLNILRKMSVCLLLIIFLFGWSSCTSPDSTMEVTIMNQQLYTHGAWHVQENRQEDFIKAWQELGDIFNSLSNPPAGKGILIQSVSDSSLFYSFGPWSSMDHIEEMRNNQQAQEGIQKLLDLCVEATPGSYRVVAESG